MSSIDERIVDMKFNNAQFMDGVKDTFAALTGLDETLKKGLNSDAFEAVSDGVDKMSSKFTPMGALALGAFTKIAGYAVDAGFKIGNALIEPLVTGGRNRALALEQARFQFANLEMDVVDVMGAVSRSVDGTAYSLDSAAKAASVFGASGYKTGAELEPILKSITGVAAQSGAEFDRITDIFSKVAGQGRVMGDDLNRMGSLGMNAAAELAKAFGVTEAEVRTMVSEGKVGFQEFSDAMYEAFGDGAAKANETYQGALSNMRSAISRIGALWYEGKVDLTTGNKEFIGHLERQRDLFNAIRPIINDVNKAVTPLMKLVNDVATANNNKLVSFLEGLSSAGGDKTFMSDVIGGMTAFAGGLTNLHSLVTTFTAPISAAWKSIFPMPSEFTGFTTLMTKFQEFTASLSISEGVLGAVGNAFKFLFSGLKAGKDVVVGVFQVFWSLLSSLGNIGRAIGDALKPVTDFVKGLLPANLAMFDFSEGIASAVAWIKAFISTLSGEVVSRIGTLGEKLESIFGSSGMTQGASNFTQSLRDLGQAAGTVFDILFRGDFTSNPLFSEDSAITNVLFNIREALIKVGETVQDVVGWFSDAAGGAQTFAAGLGNFFTGVWNVIKQVWAFVQPLAMNLWDLLNGIIEGFGRVFSEMDMATALTGANIGVLLMGLLTLKDIFGKKNNPFLALKDVAEKVKEFFEGLNGATADTKVDKLLKIAIALGLLAGAIWLLGNAASMVNSQDLQGVLTGIGGLAVSMGILIAAVPLLMKAMKGFQGGQLLQVALSLVLIAAALWVMAAAVSKLAELDWKELITGLVGLAGAMGILILATHTMAKDTASLAKLGAGLLLLSLGLLAMVGVIAVLGSMDVSTLTQGGVALVAILGMITILAAVIKNSTGLIGAGVGILLIATALAVLASVIAVYGSLPVSMLQQAGIVIGIALAAFAIAAKAMQKSLPGAAAMLVMAFALQILLPVIIAYSLIPWDTFLDGMKKLAIALALLVVATAALQATKSGSVALVAIAVAISILALAIERLAGVEGAFGALLVLAGAIGILALAAAALSPAIVPMLAIAGALALISLAAIGFSVALAIFGPAATLAAGGLIVLTNAIVALFPQTLKLIAVGAGLLVLGLGLGVMAIGVGLLATAFVILAGGLAALAAVSTLGALALTGLVLSVAKLVTHVPGMLAMGAGLLVLGAGALVAGIGVGVLSAAILLFSIAMTLLTQVGPQGIALLTAYIALIPALMTALAAGIAAFVLTILEAIPSMLGAFTEILLGLINVFVEVTPAAVEAVVGFIDTLIMTLSESIPRWIQAAVDWIIALIDGLGQVTGQLITTVGQIITDLLTGLASRVPEWVTAGMDLLIGLLNGIEKKVPDLASAATNLITTFITEIGKGGQQVFETGVDTLIEFINGISNTIETRSEEMRTAGKRLATAIINGMTGGLTEGITKVANKAAEVAKSALNAAKNFLGINSPSKAFRLVGRWSDEGFAEGLGAYAGLVGKAAEGVGQTAVDSLSDILTNLDEQLSNEMDLSPVISPVLDMSGVQRDASKLSGLLGASNLNLGGTYDTAAAIALANDTAAREAQSVSEPGNQTVLEYNQYNTSPKSLSTADIYRRTKSQLETLKEGLPI